MEYAHLISFILFFCFCNSNVCLADSDPLQDICPTGTPGDQKNIFVNGYLCKNPSTISATDFKSSTLGRAGDTDNFLQSSVTILTAAQFPGLNTQGLSISRTDLAVGGMVLPHSHPRASEMFYVSSGIVIAGFIDTRGRLFQNYLKAGDTIIFPRGLLHYSLNGGFELATAFSVLNSQNPGVMRVSDAIFSSEDDILEGLAKRLVDLSGNRTVGVEENLSANV